MVTTVHKKKTIYVRNRTSGEQLYLCMYVYGHLWKQGLSKVATNIEMNPNSEQNVQTNSIYKPTTATMVQHTMALNSTMFAPNNLLMWQHCGLYSDAPLFQVPWDQIKYVRTYFRG